MLAVWSRIDSSRKTVAVGWKSPVIRARQCGICVGPTFGLVGRNGGRTEGNPWPDQAGNQFQCQPSVCLLLTIGVTDTSHNGYHSRCSTIPTGDSSNGSHLLDIPQGS